VIEFGFLGGGRMATAIKDGLLKSKSVKDIAVYDPFLNTESSWNECVVYKSLEELFANTKWLFLCVKPQIFKAELEKFKSCEFNGSGVVSVMAGIDTQEIETAFESIPVIRTMPNTPMMLGKGMLALCSGKNASESDLSYVESLFTEIADTLIVNEDQMDGVTAISGSGPAYFFYLSEMIEKNCETLGFSKADAKKLWVNTMKGAAAMLENGNATDLKNQVTSPGGTTQAALENFDANAFGATFIKGLMAAKHRCLELGKKD
jgi:pyrroline-5-carboxylate reductase